jgi:hypothetical protein
MWTPLSSYIVLDQQTCVVYIVMMMMTEVCPHCTRPTDLGGLHSDDDDDDDDRGVQTSQVCWSSIMWTPLSSSSSLCKPPKSVGLVQCGHLRHHHHHHHHHHYVNHPSLLVDLGGLHSDDDDDDDGGVHIVLDQQTWVVYIVMMIITM